MRNKESASSKNARRRANAHQPGRKPAGDEASVSFGMMAIVPMPISRKACASATIRSIEALT